MRSPFWLHQRERKLNLENFKVWNEKCKHCKWAQLQMVAIGTNGLFNVFNVPSCPLLLRGRMHLLVLKAFSGCAPHELPMILLQRQKLQYSEPYCGKCDCSVCANLWHLFALVGGVCCLLDRVISKDDSEWEMFCCQKKKRTGCGVWSGEVSGWIWIGGGDANSRNPGQSGHCFVCSQYWAQREGEKTNTNAKTNTWKISQNYQIFGANEKATGTLNISPNSN